jgi:hypothetical protein
MAKHATVDEYIAAIPESLREVAAQARAVVDAELEARELETQAAG